MTIVKSMSRKVFAAEVVRQLEKNGISCVLVGGACVSIYTEEKHASRDLDFISPYSHEANQFVVNSDHKLVDKMSMLEGIFGNKTAEKILLEDAPSFGIFL